VSTWVYKQTFLNSSLSFTHFPWLATPGSFFPLPCLHSLLIFVKMISKPWVNISLVFTSFCEATMSHKKIVTSGKICMLVSPVYLTFVSSVRSP
jgi:hypothetical protein